MQLPIAIHKEGGSVYGVTVTGVAGCFSSGETVEEAINNAKEAIYGHLEVLLEIGEKSEIKESSIDSLMSNPDFAGAIWAMVDVYLSKVGPRNCIGCNRDLRAS
jgi:predicted RNase H-like HicB family nuclease